MSKQEEDEARTARIAKLQFERGFSDGEYGHSPAMLGGTYMDGYRRGAQEGGHGHNVLFATSISEGHLKRENANLRKRVEALEAEVESERRRLGDECDRLVIEWHDKVEDLEETLAECREAHAMTRRREDRIKAERNDLRNPETCCGCGGAATFAKWICEECTL